MDNATVMKQAKESPKMKKSARYMTVTAMLSALAFVLQFFEFPVPLMPSFIKMDLSDLPALIAAFALGPVSGVIVCLVKNLIHLTLSQTGGVGELANFLLGVAFVLPAGLIYRVNRTKGGAVIGSFAGMIIMGIASFPINYFITYPVYELFMPEDVIIAAYQVILPSVQNLAQCLLVFNVPFTMIKALCSVVIALAVYKKISGMIHKFAD